MAAWSARRDSERTSLRRGEIGRVTSCSGLRAKELHLEVLHDLTAGMTIEQIGP